MSEPAVSVLLPVRDAAATLAACLRSIARQTETSFECVVADDGSCDASLAIARDRAARDPRFRVLELPATGLVATLNTGLTSCRGRYIARMDADDLMHRERLELQRAQLEADPELAGVGCHVRVFPRAGLSDGMRAYEAWLTSLASPEDVARDVFIECPLAHPTWLVRRRVFEALPYRDRGWPEDQDWILRAHRRGLRLGVVPRRLVSWRRGGLSDHDPRYAIERFVACKAHHLARSFLPDHPHYVLWGYGGTGRALRRALAREGRLPSHIVELHPGRLGQTIHGAPVIEPSGLAGLDGPIVVSVAGAGPRGQIRQALATLGRVEGEDFVCAA
ncbi:MAG: glycosyltransferase family 2 protein [Deltaproteobacteria bacterium]|nr:glycosyltransferase family 2 protein [Deltaproteobacteria bacterium]MBW2445283.1 glycosyltransferase family 2 protein [Deltaproteobacteria bacterium]